MTFQTILTPDCVKIRVKEVKESLFECVHTANKADDLCNEYCFIIAKDDIKLHNTCFHKCQIVNNALFKNNMLWVSESLHTKLLQKVHDQLSASHLDMNQTVKPNLLSLLLIRTCDHSLTIHLQLSSLLVKQSSLWHYEWVIYTSTHFSTTLTRHCYELHHRSFNVRELQHHMHNHWQTVKEKALHLLSL